MKPTGVFGASTLMCALAVAVLLGSSSGASAQPIEIGEIVLGGAGETARGVEAATQGGRVNAFCSMHTDGVQIAVDVTNPSLPTIVGSVNPPHDDQQFDPLYYKGFLFTGHRYGGINMIDVSNPAVMTPVSSPDTHYHYKGLWAHEESDGTRYLFESEHNASGADGGLRIYDFTSGSLSLVSSLLSGDRSAGEVVVTSDGTIAYQFDNGRDASEPNTLNVYDVSDKTNPLLLVEQADMGNSPPGSPGWDMLLSADESFLFTADGPDGFKIIDVSDPGLPFVAHAFSSHGLPIEGLEFYNQSKTIVLITYQVTSGQRRVAALNVTTAPSIQVLWRNKMGSYGISDVEAHDGLIYVTTTNASNEPVLQIWM